MYSLLCISYAILYLYYCMFLSVGTYFFFVTAARENRQGNERTVLHGLLEGKGVWGH